MDDAVLSARGLGKKYLLRHESRASGQVTLRELLASSGSRAWRRLRSPTTRRPAGPEGGREDFWALRDVSFDVRRGEVVGLVGRNGAGKSTLLKIISRITEPSEGSIAVRGRVASLLEVGTGFHPELTGRENIYLNGAILGMTRAEIGRHFDRIVAFAEIERFLDTPVKRYSSGMYVRLAFAVAAHLEPEILIVDEVLAVGDAAFQRKCLARMQEIASQDRTVLFVSHNLGLIRRLCRRGLLFEGGSVAFDGSADAAVTSYLRSLQESAQTELIDRAARRGSGRVRLAGIEMATPEGSQVLEAGRGVRFSFHVTGTLPGLSCSFTLYDELGQAITWFDSALNGASDSNQPASAEVPFVCELDRLLLVPGRYRVNAALTANGELQDHVEAAAFVEVQSGAVDGRAVTGAPGYGSTFMPHRWTRPC
jgi:lipopolysaccharide transport system ATP-binding protein